jgi:hypothetical protein
VTALTSPAPALAGHRPPAPHLVRWLLRLHRPALYVWTAAFVVLGGGLLWLWGPLTDASVAAWRQWNACGSSGCSYDQDAIVRYKDVYQYTTLGLLALPLAVAAWAGGALIGREMESGTAQLSWTQGISPTRWLAAKLALPAALVTAGTGLLVLLHHLAWSAGDGRVDTAKRWYDFATFYANGPLTVALALAGLAAGALIGLLRGHSLFALAAAQGVTGLMWLALHLALPHLWPTVTSVASLTSGGPAGSGITVDEGLLTSTGKRIPDPYCGSAVDPDCDALYDRLHAVSQFKEYHPQSHYWPLQLTGGAVLLAVAALLTVAAFRVLRRRTATLSPVRTEATKEEAG